MFPIPPRRAATPEIVSSIGALDDETRNGIERTLAHRVHGLFASRKQRLSLGWRTYDEYDLHILLEVDPAILTVVAMPEKVTFLLDGERRTHVPSVRVTTRRGEAVLDAASPESRVSKAIAAVYGARGTAYRAIDRRTLRTLPRHANAKRVVAYRGYEAAADDMLRITAALSRPDGRTLRELEALGAVREPVATACAMALDGGVALDLSAAAMLDMRATLVPGGGQ